jgi:hypothetical protein
VPTPCVRLFSDCVKRFRMSSRTHRQRSAFYAMSLWMSYYFGDRRLRKIGSEWFLKASERARKPDRLGSTCPECYKRLRTQLPSPPNKPENCCVSRQNRSVHRVVVSPIAGVNTSLLDSETPRFLLQESYRRVAVRREGQIQPCSPGRQPCIECEAQIYRRMLV